MEFFSKIELHAPQFLTEKRSISHFLVLVALVAIVFWAGYRPIGIVGALDRGLGKSLNLYTAVLVVSGLLIMIVSRMVLSRLLKRHEMHLTGYFSWLVGEWALLVSALVVLAVSINTNMSLSLSTIIIRVSLFVTAILVIPYSISILLFLLREKKMELAALEAMLRQQQSSPAVRMDEMMNFYDRSGHLTFGTKRKNILYIAASDNYTNIYYYNEDHPDCFIHHCSMKQVEEAYANQGLMRCHRGYLVNVENVKLLRRKNDGLVLELYKTDQVIPVSKTYVDQVSHFFAVQV